eukprot:CAMPEP_0195517922 /NCGR_PEP_ID=MMETSP0794_2-20130614/11823_1 /TAXON_ID=515487 /ORGANISM="Stephanopyxis turris, Strain CCMP 815" /LENGTH=144 /DNA_ID=CAMNT_0040646801 /DNA_START=634 /DNA_END=1065 /DNA_ORIENTATION=+
MSSSSSWSDFRDSSNCPRTPEGDKFLPDVNGFAFVAMDNEAFGNLCCCMIRPNVFSVSPFWYMMAVSIIGFCPTRFELQNFKSMLVASASLVWPLGPMVIVPRINFGLVVISVEVAMPLRFIRTAAIGVVYAKSGNDGWAVQYW